MTDSEKNRLARLRKQRDDAPRRYEDGVALAPMVNFQWIDVDFLFQQIDALTVPTTLAAPVSGSPNTRAEAEHRVIEAAWLFIANPDSMQFDDLEKALADLDAILPRDPEMELS